MQPSSKIPMIAFSSRSFCAIFSPIFFAEPGTCESLYFTACEVSCFTFPVASHSRSFRVKNLSLKSSLQRVLYLTQALVRQPFKFRSPKRLGPVSVPYGRSALRADAGYIAKRLPPQPLAHLLEST